MLCCKVYIANLGTIDRLNWTSALRAGAIDMKQNGRLFQIEAVVVCSSFIEY